ncbi:MAG: hypothetical protein WCC90_11375, partial [Methylocella sp.]
MGQSVGPIELSGQLAAIVEVAKEMKRIIRVLMIAAMIVSVERANAANEHRTRFRAEITSSETCSIVLYGNIRVGMIGP